jgi:hypothetical protein
MMQNSLSFYIDNLQFPFLPDHNCKHILPKFK